jgi:hypothetical protein
MGTPAGGPILRFCAVVLQELRPLLRHWLCPFKTPILLAFLRSFCNSLFLHFPPGLFRLLFPCYHRRKFYLLLLAHSEPHTDNDHSSTDSLTVPLGLGQVCARPDFPRAVSLACRLLLLVSFLPCSSSLKMDMICSLERPASIRTKRRLQPRKSYSSYVGTVICSSWVKFREGVVT